MLFSCYPQARFTQIKVDGQFYGSKFMRGCSTDDPEIDCNAYQGCQQDAGSLACIYCCNDENGCNNHADVQEVAENVFKCYECNATLDRGGLLSVDISNQCGWTQSNDVDMRPCPSEMCMVKLGKCTFYFLSLDTGTYASVIPGVGQYWIYICTPIYSSYRANIGMISGSISFYISNSMETKTFQYLGQTWGGERFIKITVQI